MTDLSGSILSEDDLSQQVEPLPIGNPNQYDVTAG